MTNQERAEWRDARRNLNSRGPLAEYAEEEASQQHRMAEAIRLLQDVDDEPPHSSGAGLPGDAVLGDAVIEALSRHVAAPSLSPRSERLR